MIRPLAALPLALLLAACTSSGAVVPDPASTAATVATGAATQTSRDANVDAAPAAHAPHQRASTPQLPPLPSPVVVPLDAAVLAALPRHAARGNAHGQALDCEGVALVELLRAAGAMPVEPLRGAQLTRYVQVDGRDGDRALFSLAELDPTLGGNAVVLVDRCNGAALGDDVGPLRLLAPAESRPARWVRQVEAITVIVAP